MCTLADVQKFLSKAAALVAANDALFISRPKNKSALDKLEMSSASALKEIAGFTAYEYCKGPEEDRDRPGQVCWFFGTQIKGLDIYVKLTVQSNGGQERLVVLSFHEPDWPMRFPFN